MTGRNRTAGEEANEGKKGDSEEEEGMNLRKEIEMFVKAGTKCLLNESRRVKSSIMFFNTVLAVRRSVL